MSHRRRFTTIPTAQAAVALGLCLLATTIARGQAQPSRRAPVEELFLGSLAFTQERGEFQLASAFSATRSADGTTTALPTDVEFGLTDALQLDFHGVSAAHAPVSGWQSPVAHGASVGLTAVRHAWGHGLHAGISVDAALRWRSENDADAARRVRFDDPALLVGWDVRQVLGSHVYAKLAGAGTRCRADDEELDAESPCVAGVVMAPTDRVRLTLEAPLARRGALLDAVAPGAIWRIGGYELGAALVVSRDRRIPISGTRLLVVRDF